MRRLPTLLRAWRHGPLQIELHITPCIVTYPPGACDALVNSANEELVGTQFTPTEANSNLQGVGIIYPPQVIDGLVTELGGPEMWRACAGLPKDGHGRRCAAGCAVVSRAHGELTCSYGSIVHAVAPHYRDPDWAPLLNSTFKAALTAAAHAGFHTLAVPLLGSGARGAPAYEAAAVAASAVADWCAEDARGSNGLQHVRFAVQDEDRADFLSEALDEALGEPIAPPAAAG